MALGDDWTWFMAKAARVSNNAPGDVATQLSDAESLVLQVVADVGGRSAQCFWYDPFRPFYAADHQLHLVVLFQTRDEYPIYTMSIGDAANESSSTDDVRVEEAQAVDAEASAAEVCARINATGKLVVTELQAWWLAEDLFADESYELANRSDELLMELSVGDELSDD